MTCATTSHNTPHVRATARCVSTTRLSFESTFRGWRDYTVGLAFKHSPDRTESKKGGIGKVSYNMVDKM